MPMISFMKDMYKTFVLHAVAAHFSNGLVPIAFLFLTMALVTLSPFYEHTVLHLMIVVCLAVPVSFISGIRDWQDKFRGARAPIFIRKIILSILLFVLSIAIVGLRFKYPDILAGQGLLKWLYIGLLLMTQPVVILLGHYGGKLVFQPKRPE